MAYWIRVYYNIFIHTGRAASVKSLHDTAPSMNNKYCSALRTPPSHTCIHIMIAHSARSLRTNTLAKIPTTRSARAGSLLNAQYLGVKLDGDALHAGHQAHPQARHVTNHNAAGGQSEAAPIPPPPCAPRGDGGRSECGSARNIIRMAGGGASDVSTDASGRQL